MAKAKKVEVQETNAAAVSADLTTFAGAVAVATVETAPPATPRHYGAKAVSASALPATLAKHGATVFRATERGLARLAGQAAKRNIDDRYATAAVMLELALAGGFTAAQFWDAVAAAGLAHSSNLAFSRKGSTITPDGVFAYYAGKGFLIKQ